MVGKADLKLPIQKEMTVKQGKEKALQLHFFIIKEKLKRKFEKALKIIFEICFPRMKRL